MVVGISADPADFPFQVQILYEGKFLCSGTVLTTYLILTAAHCFKWGAYNIKDTKYRDIKVRKMEGSPEIGLAGPPILHDRWGVKSKSMEYDIALLELSDHLADVSPAILSQRKIYSRTGHVDGRTSTWVWVSGWGVSKDHKIHGVEFNRAILTIGRLFDCQSEWSDFLPDKTFCARGEGVDVSEGENGRPATCRFFYVFEGDMIIPKNVVCGIVSFGNSDDIKTEGANGTSLRPCGQTNITKPSVYTDISQYTNWIVQASCPIRTNRSSTQPSENMFECCNMFSIAKENECDEFEDCLDGSDEFRCFEGKAHKQCPPREELCKKAKVTYTVLAPTFVNPYNDYKLQIFLERGATNLEYNFRAWFIDGSEFSYPVTIQDGDHGTITILVDHLSKSAYTLVVEAVDPLDDSAFYLRQTISVGRSSRTMLFTDKDVYEIGEIVHLTAVFLDPPYKDSSYNVSISVKDSRDNLIWKYYHDDVSSSPSLISHQIPIAPHCNRGNWTVILSRVENHFTFDKPLKTKIMKTFLIADAQFQGILTNEDSIFPQSPKILSSAAPTFLPNTNDTSSNRIERPLKVRLLDNVTSQINQRRPLQIQVETSDAVAVAHLIIYSPEHVVLAKSYQPTNPRNFTIKIDSPGEIWREAKLVVFGYINETFVSDELDLEVINWPRKTNDDIRLSVSVDTVEVAEKITIFIQAKPGSTVYLHAEDAAFEDPDEFATRKWYNEMLRPSRTSQFASNPLNNFTDLRRIELEVLTNAATQNLLIPQMSFGDKGQKVTNTNRRVWLSEMIDITNRTTELEFMAPSTQGEWKIKGFVVVQEHGMRQIETLPIASFKTVATVQLPEFVIYNETLDIPIFLNNLMFEIPNETVNITVRSNGSITFGENEETATIVIQRPANKTKTIFVKMSFNQVGQLPIMLDAMVNGTITKTIKKVLSVRPNWRNTTVAANLTHLPSSDLMEMFADNVDSFASAYQNGSVESNLLLMTANAALLDYWDAAGGKNDLWKERINSLQIAYQHQLALKGSDGSFAKFANSSTSSIWLTAWTIQTFVAAEKFIYIDEDVIKGGLSFLTNNLTDLQSIDKRNVDALLDASNDANGFALTAFTLVALIKASHHCNCSGSIQWAREYLQTHLLAGDASLYEKTLAAYAEHVWEEKNPLSNSNVSKYLAVLNDGQLGNVSLQYQKLSPALKVEIHSYMSLMYYNRNAGLRKDFNANQLLEYFKFPSGFHSAHGTALAISTLARSAKMELKFPDQVKIYNGSTYICSGAVLSPYLILTGAFCFKSYWSFENINKVKNYKDIGVVAKDNRVRVSLRQPPIYFKSPYGFERGIEYLVLLELDKELKHVQPVILSSTAVYNPDGSINSGEGINGIVTRERSGDLLSGNLRRTENLTLLNVTTCSLVEQWSPPNAFCAHAAGVLCMEDWGEMTSCWITYINAKSLLSTKSVKKVLCGIYSSCITTDDGREASLYFDISKYSESITRKSRQIRNERDENCSPDEFQCRNKLCIPKSSVGDGFPDCLDGSDEHKPLSLPPNSVYNKTFCAWYKAAQGDIIRPKSKEVCFRFLPISVGTSTYDMVVKTNDFEDHQVSRPQQNLIETEYRSFVYTDKNVYFSDEIIRFGAVFLDISDSDSNISIHIRILDSSDNIVWQVTTVGSLEIERGFLSHELRASSGLNGTWTIIMRREENSIGIRKSVDVSYEKKFEVQGTTRPKFEARVTSNYRQKGVTGRFVDIDVWALNPDYSDFVGRGEFKIRVVDEWGRHLSKELTAFGSLDVQGDVSEITREFPNGGLLEVEATLTEKLTGETLTELAWVKFLPLDVDIREINSDRVRRPGLPYHAEFQILDPQNNKIITRTDEEIQTTPNIQHTQLLNGVVTITIPASSSISTDEYFRINYTSASLALDVPLINSTAKHFLQVRLQGGSANKMCEANVLKVHVMTTDVVDVLHMIIHSDAKIISYQSFPINNTKEYVFETRCPTESVNGATIVVFALINETFIVNDAIHLYGGNLRENSNHECGLNQGCTGGIKVA